MSFRDIPQLKFGFGNALNEIPSGLLSRWKEGRPFWKQIHGTRIAEVSRTGEDVGEADGLYTETPGVLLGILTADCVPILLAEKSGKAVAALHAGWRGTYDSIVSQFALFLKERLDTPLNWSALVGPAIGPCCYEVSVELAEDFRKRFHHLDPSTFIKKDRFLDLPSLNQLLLEEAGFSSVSTLRQCTHCTLASAGGDFPFQFHSFRRDQTVNRQLAVIGVTKNP